MAPEISDLIAQVQLLRDAVTESFWKKPDFWISQIIGLAGVALSGLAFWEARQAKKAATEAGRTVKLQSITIELSEVGQKLDKIQPEIRFSEARDLLSEVNRRVRRVTSPFVADGELGTSIVALRDALQAARDSLKSVKPTGATSEDDAPNAVYFAIEADFSAINNLVADLLGLFEKKTLDLGDDDGNA